MALNITAIDKHELVKFIPTFGDQRKLKEADSGYKALTFHFKKLSERQAELFREFEVIDGELTLNQVTCSDICAKQTEKIENFSLTLPNGTKVDINSGEKLDKYRDGLPSSMKFLLLEVGTEIIRVSNLTEEEVKNSK